MLGTVETGPRIAIVGGSRNETNLDLVARWRALGLDALLLSPGEAPLVLGRDDVIVGRLDVLPTLDGIEPGITDLETAARLGARVVNEPNAIFAAHDKLRTARLLAAARIPHPRTEHLRPGRLPTLEPPLVIKPRFGSWGSDVLRCESRGDVHQALLALEQRGWFRLQGAIAQALIPPCGYDLRVLVADGVVAGALRRVAAPGEWRTNISLGGSYRHESPSPAAKALAVAAVAALGGEFFGVDLMPARSGYLVLEVNAAIEFDEGYSLDGGDVFADAAGALDLIAPVRLAAVAP